MSEVNDTFSKLFWETDRGRLRLTEDTQLYIHEYYLLEEKSSTKHVFITLFTIICIYFFIYFSIYLWAIYYETNDSVIYYVIIVI